MIVRILSNNGAFFQLREPSWLLNSWSSWTFWFRTDILGRHILFSHHTFLCAISNLLLRNWCRKFAISLLPSLVYFKATEATLFRVGANFRSMSWHCVQLVLLTITYLGSDFNHSEVVVLSWLTERWWPMNPLHRIVIYSNIGIDLLVFTVFLFALRMYHRQFMWCVEFLFGSERGTWVEIIRWLWIRFALLIHFVKNFNKNIAFSYGVLTFLYLY